MSEPEITIQLFGERGALARIAGFADDIASGLYANAVADNLRSAEGVLDAVAGVDSVVLRLGVGEVTKARAQSLFEGAAKTVSRTSEAAAKTIEIPVCYGGDYGPDLAPLAEICGLSEPGIISAHAGRAYRVITLGFAPGFAYLGGLDPRIAAPRLATPRAHVAAGSIGIANEMSGVYSLASPGGWRIIGRTPKRLFDRAAEPPFLISAGMAVRFQPISEAAFKAASSNS